MTVRLRTIPLAGLLVGLSLASWTLAGRAQVIDADPCERTCQEQHEGCIDRCSEGDNPVECDAQCDDQSEDCLRRCGG